MARSLLLALCLVLAPALAAAQDAAVEDASPARPPVVRLDVGVPNVGIGAASFDPEMVWAFGGHVALAHSSGHGARVDLTLLVPDSGDFLGPHRAHGEGWVLDTAYLHRFRLAGDDRLGLGVDLSAGVTGGEIRFHQATNGFCWGGCPDPGTVTERVADGAYLGANLGGSLDFRAYGFVMGIDVRYRALLALEPAGGDRIDQHALSGTAYLGFGFH